MAALTAERDTLEKASSFAMLHNKGVAASVKIYQGSLVVVDATGYLAPATTATTLVAAGIALETVDNSSGSAGDVNCDFRSGIFKVANDGDINADDEDVLCNLVDDQTVSLDGTGKSSAGRIYQVDSDGVFVAINYPIA